MMTKRLLRIVVVVLLISIGWFASRVHTPMTLDEFLILLFGTILGTIAIALYEIVLEKK